MTGKQIKVTIDTCGRPTIEAVGFMGESCKTATKPIEDVFKGGEGVETHFKPEYHQVDTTAEQHEVGM